MPTRSCPACTLMQSHVGAKCELCEAPLPPLPPSAPAATGNKRKPAPTGQKNGVKAPKAIADFFKPSSGSSGSSSSSSSSAPLLPPVAPPQEPVATLTTVVTTTSPTVAAATASSSSSSSSSSSLHAPPLRLLPNAAACAAEERAELTAELAAYAPCATGWAAGAAVPYAHVAAALDAVSATRSRLIKEKVLTNTFRSALAHGASALELEALCYLLSPSKDAQTGGHRLRPDWSLEARPLGLSHGAITGAVLEATGASRGQLSAAYGRLRDSGDAALAVRDGASGGGRQTLLLRPPPLTASGVLKTLRGLGNLSGQGVEKAKTTKLAGLLRASRGTELKWLVRTFVPHMQCGISLEASVLPALAAAALIHAHAHASCPPRPVSKGGGGVSRDGGGVPLPALPGSELVSAMQDAMRAGYALYPDVRALIDAVLLGLLSLHADDAADTGRANDMAAASSTAAGAKAASSAKAASASVPLRTLAAQLAAVCTLRPGVPSQPMLAKPCTSIEDAVRMLRSGDGGSGGGGGKARGGGKAGGTASSSEASGAGSEVREEVRILAEHKYDGQRAQVHRLADGTVRLFSRKLDDMTTKYPDVCAAIGRSSRSGAPFIADGEIVPLKGAVAAPPAATAAADGVDVTSGGGSETAKHPAAAAEAQHQQQQLGTFQSLSTRKRKGVTEANAASSSVPVCLILFDLLQIGETCLLEAPLSERRRRMRDEFEPVGCEVSFAASVELTLSGGRGGASCETGNGDACKGSSGGGGGSGDGAGSGGEGGDADEATLRAVERALAHSVQAGCEGLMLKRLTCPYVPSWGTRRSDGWVKCKKDYIAGMGDSVDLVPIGGWRGQGRKKRWISPWLMATYDPASG